MATAFATPGNNVSTTVGTATTAPAFPYNIALVTGGGAKFPPLPSPNTYNWYYRVTVCQVAFAYSPTASNANYTIYKADSISGDNLHVTGVLEGTSDRPYAVGDIVEVRVTSGTLNDVQNAVNALEAGGGGGMAIGGTVTGGTTNSVLFVDGSSHLAQDNTNFTYSTTSALAISSTSVTPLNISNNSTTSGPGTANFNRGHSGANNIFQFISTYTALSAADPLWSFGVNQSQSGFLISNWEGSSGKSFLSIATSVGGYLMTFGSGQNVFIRGDGSIGLASIANASAVNNSLFWDTTGLKLTYKDGSGVLHAV